MNMRQKAIKWLYRELKRAKIALGYAESRQGVTHEERLALQTKIDVLDYLTTLVNKEPVEE